MPLPKPAVRRGGAGVTPRLPPLPYLGVRRGPEAAAANPCVGVMSSVLGCWASNGAGAETCASLEQALRACMDTKQSKKARRNEINSHLHRFFPKMQTPTKKK